MMRRDCFGAPTYMGTAPWQFKSLLMQLQKFGLRVVGKIKYLQALQTARA